MAIPSKLTFYKLNDQLLEVSGLHDGLVPTTFFNAATVNATLYDRAGVVADSALNNLTLSYVTASDGIYRGQIEQTFDPPASGGYSLVINATQGTTVAKWTISSDVKVRKV